MLKKQPKALFAIKLGHSLVIKSPQKHDAAHNPAPIIEAAERIMSSPHLALIIF